MTSGLWSRYIGKTGNAPAWRRSRVLWSAALLAVAFFLTFHNLRAPLSYGVQVGEIERLTSDVAGGNLDRWIGFLLLGASGGLALLIGGRPRWKPDPVLTSLLLASGAWAALSLTWSHNFPLTIRRLGVLGLMVTGALGLVKYLSPREFAWTVFHVGVAFVLIGVGNELRLGTLTTIISGSRFGGTLHPNHQGMNCALLMLTSAYLSTDRESPRWPLYCILVIAVVLLIMTRSRTALAAGLGALFLFFIARSSLYQRGLTVLGLGLAVSFVVFLASSGLVGSPWEIFLLGREASNTQTLTGRVPLWNIATRFIEERPLLGFGFNSFWDADHSYVVSQLRGWGISEAHSSYVDMLLGLGLGGLLLMVVTLATAVARAWSGAQRAPEYWGSWATALLGFAVANGLLESALVRPTQLSFTVLVVVLFLSIRPLRTGPVKHGPVPSGLSHDGVAERERAKRTRRQLSES